MAVQGNMYALLESDSDVENLLSRFAATTGMAEEPVEMQKGNRRTPSSQNLSKLQPPFDQGSQTERQNGNDFKRYNVQQNVSNSNGYRPDERPGYRSKKHEAQRSDFQKSQDAGYRPDRRPGYTSKQQEGQRNTSVRRQHGPDDRPAYISKQHEGQRRKQEPTNGGQRPADSSKQHETQLDGLKKEAETNEGCRPDERPADGSSDDLKKEEVSDDGGEWQVIRRRNHHRRLASLGNEEGGERSRERQRRGERRREFVGNGNVGEGNGERREFKGDGSVGRGERSRGREINGDARRGFQGDINGGIAEKLEDGKVERGNEEGFDNERNGMTSLEENARSKVDVAVVDSKEPESKNSKEPEFRKWQRDQRMTLKDYEKQLEEKRKVLESMKKQEERVVTLDKDFESMHVVEKKKEEKETIFIKLNSESDRPKKKVTTGKNGSNAPKPLVTNFKLAGTENRVGRYSRREESRDREGGYPRRKEEGHKVEPNENGGYPRRKGGYDGNKGIGDLKREEEKPASIEEQFPSLYKYRIDKSHSSYLK